MPSLTGRITAFYLFDIADAIDLAAVQRLVSDAVTARFTPGPPVPPYVQYRQPPIALDGSVLQIPSDGLTVRLKVFDYGVVSVALSAPMPTTWEQLLSEGIGWHENPRLAETSERLCRALAERIAPAISKQRADYLSEDYVVFVSENSAGGRTDALLEQHGNDIAQLLRGERERLSAQECAEVLAGAISYLATDLVIPTWSAAFVYDAENGAQAALEILEFANSQLLEFRYYDQLLDRELEGIYGQLLRPGWAQSWFGRRYTRAARHVHALFVDVNELTDRTENALKIAGDVYAARLFALAASRLGLQRWKSNVEEKLRTLDEIYRFAVEQAGMTRGEFMELTIVLILVLELVLLLLGIR
jgi:hypothetical protein